MAFCKSCGADIGDAKFCASCGTSQEVTLDQNPSEPISAPVFTPDPSSYASSGDTAGSSSSEIPVYTAPVYSDGATDKPNTTGSMVFSIINIALGFLLCCCTGVSFVSMILGIIALVFTMQAGKANTTEEAAQKLKSAKIMNIIGVVLLALGLLIGLIVMLVSGTGAWTDAMSNYDINF